MTGPDAPSTALPIFQYWHSEEIPAEIAELTASFRDRNRDSVHRVFCEAEAERLIAAHFTAREVAAFRACAVPAMQADYFRYAAVLALGGVYSDAGFRCLRSLQGLIAMADRGLLFQASLGQVINGFFLFKRPGHPLLRLALEVATRQIEQRSSENVWSVTGPWIFSALAALHQLGSSAALRRRAAELEMETSPDLLLRAAGNREQVAAAFDGVRIVPFEATTASSIDYPNTSMAYRREDAHWVNWQNKGRTIFRS